MAKKAVAQVAVFPASGQGLDQPTVNALADLVAGSVSGLDPRDVAIVDGRNKSHPVLQGVNDVFGPTDVYGVNPDFPADATILLFGQVLKGMKPDDGPNLGKAVMPIVWLRDYKGESGKTSRMLCSTIGAATDLQSEDLRRLFVNSAYHLTGLPVPKKAEVTVVGEYAPTMFGFNKFIKDVKVSSHELK